MIELSLDNILTGSEVENLFVDEVSSQDNTEDTSENNDNIEDNKDIEETTEVSVDTLFTDKPESVGSEKEDNKETEDADSDKSSTSPTIYSSIAKAFAEEGIFSDLDEDSISEIKSSEDFKDLIEKQIQSRLDERYKRVDEALNAGVEPNEIKQYEVTLNYLDSIKEDDISLETEEGENLRKRLIYQDFINRGYSKERAEREIQKSFNGGTDIEDAKEALKGNKEFFQHQYKTKISEAQKERDEIINERKEQANKLKNSILNDKKVFGDLEVDKNTRQRIYDNIAKPVYKDPDTGEMYTAIQKYEMENRTEFLKNLSLIFTLTEGFKNLDGLVKNKVRKEVNKGFKELENTLNNTSRTSDGNLKFISGVDSESFISKGWTIDA